MSRDNAYLTDILNSARSIISYIQGMSQEQFEQNVEKQDAVIRRYAIIGEAAGRLSADTLKALPTLPWRQMTGMRNILVHDYDDVDDSTLWETARNDLPNLISEIEIYLSRQPRPPGT